MKRNALIDKVKNITGHTLTRYAPSLIRYFSKHEVRARFKCSSNSSFIDISEIKSTRSIRISKGNAVYILDI